MFTKRIFLKKSKYGPLQGGTDHNNLNMKNEVKLNEKQRK